jgi:hypothetical protein
MMESDWITFDKHVAVSILKLNFSVDVKGRHCWAARMSGTKRKPENKIFFIIN